MMKRALALMLAGIVAVGACGCDDADDGGGCSDEQAADCYDAYTADLATCDPADGVDEYTACADSAETTYCTCLDDSGCEADESICPEE